MIMNTQNIFPMGELYSEYIRDESQYTGRAQNISFPRNEEEIRQILKELQERNIPVTVQGGKTGIVGSGVPSGGHLMNLENCGRVLGYAETDGKHLLTIEPGLRLSDLKQEIAKLNCPVRLFWPPNPTETSATIGGIAATAASGINSFAYGDTRQYFESARVVLADGTVREIRRGERFLTVNGQSMDELDAFLGSEGMLGVFTSLTLRLLPAPAEQWGIAFFFEDRRNAWEFADRVQGEPIPAPDAELVAAEYIDRESIQFLENKRGLLSKLNTIPPIDPVFDAMVYLEIAGEETGIESIAERLMEWAEQCGSDPDCTWAVSDEKGMENLRVFRHAIPETVNLSVEENHRSCPEITKLSTDFSFSGKAFSTVMGWYEERLSDLGIAHCIFGHIGESHLHVNFVAKDLAEQEQCEDWMRSVLRETADLGGCAARENGIGKVKANWIPSENETAARMRALKKIYDPQGFWNPGNMFHTESD